MMMTDDDDRTDFFTLTHARGVTTSNVYMGGGSIVAARVQYIYHKLISVNCGVLHKVT